MAKSLEKFEGRVIFAGGGTGGHLYPGVALAEELSKRGFNNYIFLASSRQIDRDILEKAGYTFISQNVSAFMGVGILGKVKSLLSLFGASLKAMKYIKKGDVVILTGGFAAAPSCIAGYLKGASIYLHEQNSVMGLVNRLCSKMAKKVFLSFKDMRNFDDSSKKAVLVGNPVRSEFYNIEREDIKGECKNILIMGGSQGSKIINSFVAKAARSLMEGGFNIVHQAGGKLYDEVLLEYGEVVEEYKGRLEVVKYIDDVVSKMKWADIIISRSGAGAVFEIRSARLPAIFIPFAKASENHQYYNALELVEGKAAEIILENELSEEVLLEAVNKLNENIDLYRSNIASLAKLESSKLILDEVFCE